MHFSALIGVLKELVDKYKIELDDFRKMLEIIN